jgi:uncharacterized membrane protein
MCTVFVVPCALCVARIEVLLPSIANDGQDRQHIVTDINGTYRGKEFVRLCYFITQQKGTFTATFFRLALVFVFGILQVPVSKSYCPRSQMMDRIGNTLPRTRQRCVQEPGIRQVVLFFHSTERHVHCNIFRLALVFVFGILQVPVSKSYCPRSQMMDRIGNTLPRTRQRCVQEPGIRQVVLFFHAPERHVHCNIFSSCFGVCLWYSAGASIKVLLPSIANDGQNRQHIATDDNGMS